MWSASADAPATARCGREAGAQRDATMTLKWLLDLASALKQRLDAVRLQRRRQRLCAKGLHIGAMVRLPASTWIDDSHCFLISIGDRCGFGEGCVILAHDAQMYQSLGVTRVGRVTIHEQCHIGSQTVLLPGVEVGPRTIVGANSVVSRSLPPETVCAGVPARVICSLQEYLEKHRQALATAPTFPFDDFDIGAITPERRDAMREALQGQDGYIVGSAPILEEFMKGAS